MKLALLVLFTGTTLAAPFWVLDENLPRAEVKVVGCSGNRFQGDQSHVYEYAGETLNTVEGATTRTTGLSLTARIVISPMSECRFRMLLSSVKLMSKSMTQDTFATNADSAKLKSELERYQLEFTMIGNTISTLYTNKNELPNILNIKRGILSTLQLDEAATEEIDVNGKCAMKIENIDGTVVKAKKLSECSHRAQNEIGFQSSSIKSATNLKPLDSSSTCKYSLDGDGIESAICDETHIFQPFSAGYETPSGAITTVKQTLKLKGKYYNELASLPLDTDFEKEFSLVFDHTTEEPTATATINDQVEKVMLRLVNPSSNVLSAKQDSAHEFTTLVRLLRKMDEKRMKIVWDKYFDCLENGVCSDANVRDLYRQYLLDAVAYCGTSTCISMVHNVIIDGKVSGERMNMFLQSIALVGKTTLKMIGDVLNICKKQPSRQSYLTLGTLMARHCASNPEECNSNPTNPVALAEQHLGEILGEECQGQDSHIRVEEILRALKAIGNARRPINIQDVLLKCALKSKHANMTSSIFDAFRGMPCDSLNKEGLLRILNSEENSDESRIHAFITLMKCPSEDVLEYVVRALENEDNNQVASFMWTYLTNLIESSDPVNAKAKEALKAIVETRPLREVNLPFQQFSKAFEKSLYSEFLKSGLTTESHIIYNRDRLLPRMGMFNMKANVMGYPVNMLETKVGVDGVESVLETLIGPNGVISKDFNIDLGKYGKYNAEFLEKLLEKKNNMKKTFNDNLTKMHLEANKKFIEPNAHLSVKIMDQEIKMLSYDDILWLMDQIDDMNVVQLLKNYARGGHKVFSKSLMFLEMTHTVPTGLGLPLKLKLTGSSVTTVEMKGQFDIRNLFWGNPAMNIKGYVKPSTVIELSGQMGIESQFVSSGMFVNSSMFMSQIVKGGIEYKHGQILKVNMDVPEEPISLVNFSSTPYLFMNEESQLIEGTERRITPEYCYKSEIIGYGFCANMRLPFAFREYEAPYFPLSGPAYFGIKLIRGDDQLTTWQFLVSLTKKQQVTTGMIGFSTPGAKYERKINGEMLYSQIGNTKSLTFKTEKFNKKASIEFSYNTVTHRSAIITKNNLFANKDLITKLVYFNQTKGTIRQYGLLCSSEYDWYKFEHVTKFVRKPTSYIFKTSTMYYPKKTVSGTVEFDTEERKLTATVDADQFNKAYEFTGKYSENGEEKGITLMATCLKSRKSVSVYGGYQNSENTKLLLIESNMFGVTSKNVLGYYKKGEIHEVSNFLSINGKTITLKSEFFPSPERKTVKLSAEVLGRKTFTKFVITNTAIEKSVSMNIDALGKNGQAKIGCYDKPELKECKFDFDLMGKQGEIFATYTSIDGNYNTNVGASFDKYIGGLRGLYSTNHGHGKSFCSSMFYGTKDNEKQPFTLCLKYHSLGSSYIHKRVSATLDLLTLKKNGEISLELEKHNGHIKLQTKVSFNKKDIGKMTNSLKYSSNMNNELAVDVIVGKYVAGYKWFTVKTFKGINAGVSAYLMNKSLKFEAKYEKKEVDGIREMRLKTEMMINNESIPVTTEVFYAHGNGVSGPTFKLNIGKYSGTYSTRATYGNGYYGLDCEYVIKKEENTLFEIVKGTSLILTGKSKRVKQSIRIRFNGKEYGYGWDASYENWSTDLKMTHVVNFGLQYSTSRKSSIKLLLSNDESRAALDIKFDYIPTKSVSHYIQYLKAEKEMEISVEFLPKMFYIFNTKLVKNNGYTLESSLNLKWKNYKRSLKMANTYVNNDEKLEVSTGFGKDVSLSLLFDKTKPKSLTLAASVFENTAKVIGVWTPPAVQIRLVYNNKVIVNVATAYDQFRGNMKLALTNAKGTLFKALKSYNGYKNQHTFQIFGKKEWLAVVAKYNKRNQVGKLAISLLGVEYIKFKAEKQGRKVSLTIESPKLKKNIVLSGSLNRPEKSFTLAAKYGQVNLGYVLRMDWVNLVLAEKVFYNKNSIGVKLYVENHSLNIRMVLSPTMIAKLVFEVQDDRILKFTLQRYDSGNLVNETSLQYTLSKDMCSFALNWNAKTIQKVFNMLQERYTEKIEPVLEKVTLKAKQVSRRAIEASKTFVADSTKDLSKSVFEAVNNLDRSFDEFDFVAAKNQLGEVSLEGLKKLSELVKKSLKLLINGLESIKENMPELLKKYKQLKKKSTKLSEEVLEVLEKLRKDLNKNWDEMSVLAIKVAKNLTDSTKPVITKAIALIKNFKIRGKPLTELFVMVKDLVKKYVELYSEAGKLQLEQIRIRGKQLYEKTKKYMLKLKVPYRSETVEKVIEIVTSKALELKDRLSAIDIKNMIEDIKIKLAEYKINGKTVTRHFEVMKKDIKNLPKSTKLSILRVIELIRIYAKDADTAIAEMTQFLKPLRNYLIVVRESTIKHFKPIMNKSWKRLVAKIPTIQLPNVRTCIMKKWKIIERFFLPLIKPIVPLFNNLKQQISQMKIGGFSLGSALQFNKDMIEAAITDYMKTTKKSLDQQIAYFNKKLDLISKMTAEEIVEESFKTSKKLTKACLDWTTQMYEDREMLIKKLRNKVKASYQKLIQQYQTMKSLTVNELIDDFVYHSSRGITSIADELSQIIKQIAELEISKPTWKAWKEADVMGHLGKYGVNQKMMDLIQAAKEVNITKLAVKTSAMIQDFVVDIYVKVLEISHCHYQKMRNIYDYILSIPKKEYDQWFNELQEFSMIHKDKFIKFMNKIWDMSQEKAKKLYADSLDLYSNLKRASIKTLDDFSVDYVEPAKEYYVLVAEKSKMVYDDIKQPTIDVTNHYKDILNEFLNNKYQILKGVILRNYKAYSEQLEMKMQKMKDMMEKMYNQFLEKYGDMTWEEIYLKVYQMGKKQIKIVKKSLLNAYKKLDKKFGKFQAKAKKLYYNGVDKYNEVLNYLKSDIKPKIEKLYKHYKALMEQYTEVYTKATKKVIEDIKSRSMTIYKSNKDKTLKVIYTELKTLFLKQMKKQYLLLKKFTEKKVTQLQDLSMKYYDKAFVLMTNVIIPEIKMEGESFINQTLRAVVTMSQETVKAYTPHANIALDSLSKANIFLKEKYLVAISKAEVLVKEYINQLINLLKDLMGKIKEHEMYNKIINHEYVSEIQHRMKKLSEVMNNKLSELKMHPKTIEYQEKLKVKISEIKLHVQMYQQELEKYYEHPKVVRALQTLKKLQKSFLFTIEKLWEKLEPTKEEIMETTTQIIAAIPEKSKNAALFFREAPEEAFWVAIANVKENAKLALDILRKTIKEEYIKETLNEWKSSLKTQFKILQNDCFDDYAKATSKYFYEKAVEATKYLQMNLKKLPATIKKTTKTYYDGVLRDMEAFYRKQKQTLGAQWENCPYRMLVENPVWTEITEEIMQHEIAEAVKYLAGITREKALEMKKLIIEKYEEKKSIATEKLFELKATLKERLEDVKGKLDEKWQLAERRYEEVKSKAIQIKAKVENFFDTTTVADIVDFVQEKYEESIVKVQEYKLKLIQLKSHYLQKSKSLYGKHKQKAQELYDEYKNKAVILYKKYEEKLKPIYKKYKKQIMEFYDKYYPIILEKYEIYKEKALEKYNEIKIKSTQRYNELKSKANKYYAKYQEEALALFEKTKTDIFNAWRDSKIRSKLLEFSKMTIRQTVAALKKLPKETKEFVLLTYILHTSYIHRYYQKAQLRRTQEYAKYQEVLLNEYDKLIVIVEPYTAPIIYAYKWLENELTETALFVYKYHRLAEKYSNTKSLLESEMKRLLPIVKASIKKYCKDAKSYAIESFENGKEAALAIAKEYKEKAMVMAEKYSFLVGDKTLRSIHSSLQYLDNIDLNQMKNKLTKQARSVYTAFTKHVSIDLGKGEILITIPHPEVAPSFSYQYEKLQERARRSVKAVQMKSEELMEELNDRIAELKIKTKNLSDKLMKKIMDNTVEIRTDLKESYRLNKEIFHRAYLKGKVVYRKMYNKAITQYRSMELKSKLYLNKAKEFARSQYKKMIKASQGAYLKASEIFIDIYNTPYTEMYGKIEKYSKDYYNIIKQRSLNLYNTYKPLIKQNIEQYISELKKNSKLAYNEMIPYAESVKSVYNQVKSGVPVKDALYPFYKEMIFALRFYQGEAMKQYRLLKMRVCREDPKLCKNIRYSAKYHEFVFNKYFKRLMNIMEKVLDMYTEGVVKGQRSFRKLKAMVTQPKPAYDAVATVFNNHYVTFDGKLHSFEIPSPKCQYVLMHDFQNSDFTVLKTKDAIKIKNKDMKVVIFNNGKVSTKFSSGKIVYGLPVESNAAKCLRKENLIFCNFPDDKFQVVTDLKHSIVTIAVSAWHHGKLQGLLGTNNRETFDDMKMPSGFIADSETKFTNAYEMTSHSKCQLSSAGSTQKCGSNSMKCMEIFQSANSKFAPYFNIVNSEVFLEACKEDTTSCQTTESPKYCASANAYVQVVRAKGYPMEHVDECITEGTRKVGEEWQQRISDKEIDIVVLVSQRKNTDKRQISKVLHQLQGIFKSRNFDTRYALVGFGGQGIHEEAHLHPLGTGFSVFGNMHHLRRELTHNMPFKGEGKISNDAYHAIVVASGLSFRPGAHKIFVMFNTEPHASHKYGASYTEAMFALEKEAGANLFVFDEFNFKSLNKKGSTIGQTIHKIYTTKNLSGLQISDMELPSSEFKDFVIQTNGGMFSNKLVRPSDFSTILSDAISDNLAQNKQKCRVCKLTKSWHGFARHTCKSDIC